MVRLYSLHSPQTLFSVTVNTLCTFQINEVMWQWSFGSDFFCLACVHIASVLQQVLYFIAFSSQPSKFLWKLNLSRLISEMLLFILFSILNKLVDNIRNT